MIRLTELRREARSVEVRLEGSLSAAGLDVLRSALRDYRAEGLDSVAVAADGLVLVDRLAMREWPSVLPEGLGLSFATTRRSLAQLLESCGVDVELRSDDPGAQPQGAT